MIAPRSLAPLVAALIGLAGLSHAPAAAASTRLLAFGDSITEGYGDDPENPNPGYPPRLEGSLRGAGFDVRIANHGSGGETTAEGLSRIDSVLDEGGEVLLLMEGTNDINRLISGETIRFNLNAMASKAEARGMRAVHATLIPHRPDGTSGDTQNFATRDVRIDILGLAASQGRAVVDAFSVFWNEPDYASRFYVDLPTTEDPVGHPNAAGYDLLADAFFDVVRDVLQAGTGSGRIEVLSQPIVAGQIASFGVDLRGSFASVTWKFGDEGRATGQVEDGYAADYVFDRPGTFRVSVQAIDAAGRVVTDQVDVVVQGSVPSWRTARALAPLARRFHPVPGGARRWTELRLVNLGPTAARVEIELLTPGLLPREIGLRAARGPIALGLRPGQTALLADVLAALGVGEGSGALRVTARTASGSLAPAVEAKLRLLTLDAAGERSEAIAAVPEAEWQIGARFVGGLDSTFGAGGALVLANPESQAGTVNVQLLDAAGLPRSSTALTVPPSTALTRALPRLFPTLLAEPGLSALRVDSPAVKMVVGLEAALPGGDDRAYVPMPVAATSNLPDLFLPTLGNRGDGYSRRLSVVNPGLAELQLRFALLRLGANNTSPPVADRTVPAGGSLVIDDPRAQLFGQGDGVGLIRVTWSGAGGVPPVIVGTTGSAIGPVGSLGTSILASATAGVFYESALLAADPPSSTWTPVLGLMELESLPLTVRVELLDLTGESLGARNVQLLRRELDEIALDDLFPNLSGTGWSLSLSLPDGGIVLAYLASRSASGDLAVIPATALTAP